MTNTIVGTLKGDLEKARAEGEKSQSTAPVERVAGRIRDAITHNDNMRRRFPSARIGAEATARVEELGDLEREARSAADRIVLRRNTGAAPHKTKGAHKM